MLSALTFNIIALSSINIPCIALMYKSKKSQEYPIYCFLLHQSFQFIPKISILRITKYL